MRKKKNLRREAEVPEIRSVDGDTLSDDDERR